MYSLPYPLIEGCVGFLVPEQKNKELEEIEW
jgi:hypothetical protein